MNTIETLEQHGFIETALPAEEILNLTGDTARHEISEYKGWKVGLLIPNGGYLGVDLAHPLLLRVYRRYTETEPDHDYCDGDRLCGLAKAVIDAILTP